MTSKTEERRKAEIKLIQIAKRQLNMEDDVYRQLLRQYGGVESSTELDGRARGRLLDHFAKLGFVSQARQKRAAKGAMNVATDKQALIGKIDALLLSQGRDRRYIEPGMVRRICKVDGLAFCTAEHLGKLIAALQYDLKRQQTK